MLKQSADYASIALLYTINGSKYFLAPGFVLLKSNIQSLFNTIRNTLYYKFSDCFVIYKTKIES